MILSITILFILVIIIYWSYINSSRFTITVHKITSDKVKRTSKFLIIADYHGNKHVNHRLLRELWETGRYDGLFLLGDITDRKAKDFEKTKFFLKLFDGGIHKCYVFGNHEKDCQWETELEPLYAEFGFEKMTEQPFLFMTKEGDKIAVYGRDFYDPGVDYVPTEGLNLLLTHSYVEFKWKRKDEIFFDGILSGHTHGGQIRFPGIGQIVGHGFEFFPEFSKGAYLTSKGEPIFISSGLGNSSLPIRLFNPVEVVELRVVPKKPKA